MAPAPLGKHVLRLPPASRDIDHNAQKGREPAVFPMAPAPKA